MKHHHLLLLLSLLAISLSRNAATTPVYDTDGHELTAEASYYVLPVGRERRDGGLTLSPHVLPCPLFVAQDGHEGHRGLPVRFTLRGAAPDRVIRVSGEVRVRFAAVTPCVQSTEWRLGGREPVFGRRHVLTGPPAVFDPEGATGDVFRVEEAHGGAARQYKLASCRASACTELGVFQEGGKAWLGVSDSALVVVFKKA